MRVGVEQISYRQDDELIKLKGKGYGEGELIKFALNNSVFLKNQNNFFKCTGKVFCRNFDQVLKLITKNNIQNIFWRHLGEGNLLKPWADLRFFYTTREFCEDSVIPAYLKSDDTKWLRNTYALTFLGRN